MSSELLDAFNNMLATSEDQTHLSLNSRVLIIDGMNTFIRSFAAVPTMDDNGNHIGGITGFLKSVGYAIRKFKPTRVYIVFDGKGGSKRRKEFYPEYKAGRKMATRLNRAYDMTSDKDEQDLMKYELVVIAKVLMNLPVTTMTLDYVEADDIMSYISQYTVEQGGKSIIYSTDKDFLQLVTEDIIVWNPIKKKIYDQDSIVEEYNIHPNNFLLYRAIIGDNSDNIPGIKGLGTKTLLKHVPSFISEDKVTVEQIHDAAKASTSKLMHKMYDSKEVLDRNLYLMSLSEANMSGSNKLKILNRITEHRPELKKFDLTKLLNDTNIMDAMGNYDQWIATTFLPLTRFND